VPRFKQRYEFVCPDYGNLYALLDAVKVADCLLFVLNPHDTICSYGELCLSAVFAQGLPASVLAIQVTTPSGVQKLWFILSFLSVCHLLIPANVVKVGSHIP